MKFSKVQYQYMNGCAGCPGSKLVAKAIFSVLAGETTDLH
jgi:hypothetical protein